MNKRIEELAKQSGSLVYGNCGGFNGMEFDVKGVEQFAKLIVLECVSVIDREIDRLNEYGKTLDDEHFKLDVYVSIETCINTQITLLDHFQIDNLGKSYD